MEPAIEVPLVFRCWEYWLQGLESVSRLRNDFIEIHAFGAQPKSQPSV